MLTCINTYINKIMHTFMHIFTHIHKLIKNSCIHIYMHSDIYIHTKFIKHHPYMHTYKQNTYTISDIIIYIFY